MFTKLIATIREPVNSLTHFMAAIISIIGLIVLILLGWSNAAKEVALIIYGVSLILMFCASSIYHWVKARSGVIEWLRKLDHSAIYLLIAGTYTPFCVISFKGFWEWGLLAIIWSLAITGIVVKMFIIRAPRWLSAGVYIMMGWLCLAAVGEMLQVLPAGALAWLVTGGVVYTLGALVYITKALDFFPGKFGFHEVWHIFVILGALAHFIAIAAFIAG